MAVNISQENVFIWFCWYSVYTFFIYSCKFWVHCKLAWMAIKCKRYWTFSSLCRCGSFVEALQEVHLFLSARGGQTKLHQDPYSNIHCVFNGTKDWLLVHPDQTNLVYMSDDSAFEWGGYSEIDVDSVDLELFPLIKEVHYSKVTMNKGDCIFMPGGELKFSMKCSIMVISVNSFLSHSRHLSTCYRN